MEKNSSCSRVSARLVMHQLAELQLTAPLKKSATKFYNRPNISSRFALQFSRYFVLVL